MALHASAGRSRGLHNRFIHVSHLVYGARRKLATGAAAVLALTVGYHVVFGQNGLTVYRAKRHDIRQLSSQIEELRHENDELHAHVNRLTSDPDAIEHEAREELHYTRPGEVIYSMPPDDRQPPPK